MIHYYVLSEDSYYKLQVKVNEMTKGGWTPQGGIAVSTYGMNQYFYQAVVKKDAFNGSQATF